jgi:hypothetical protein
MQKGPGRGRGRASAMVVMLQKCGEVQRKSRRQEGGGGVQNPCTSLYVQSYRGVLGAKSGIAQEITPNSAQAEVGRKWGVSECCIMTSSLGYPPNFGHSGELKPTLVTPSISRTLTFALRACCAWPGWRNTLPGGAVGYPAQPRLIT